MSIPTSSIQNFNWIYINLKRHIGGKLVHKVIENMFIIYSVMVLKKKATTK